MGREIMQTLGTLDSSEIPKDFDLPNCMDQFYFLLLSYFFCIALFLMLFDMIPN